MAAPAELITDESCVFCAIVAGRVPAAVVYDDQDTLAFMDINPANPGHVLVVPKNHARDIFDVCEQDAQHVMRTVVRVARAIDQSLDPDGMNLIQANRRAGWQSVYHFHIHIVPRWRDDGLVPIWRHRPGDPDELAKMATRIQAKLAQAQ